MFIRPATEDEFDEIGQLCVRAYAAAGVAATDSDYALFLADVSHRATAAETEVLAAVDGGRLVGTATMCGFGSPLTVVCEPGEMEPRAVAVHEDEQGRGVAATLMQASTHWAREHRLDRVVVCVTTTNHAAMRLYERLGFDRRPQRDWVAPDGTQLLTYTQEVPQGFCPRCGEPETALTHEQCAAALALEPPRYCPTCRRRLKVQIVPTGYSALCSRHGPQ